MTFKDGRPLKYLLISNMYPDSAADIYGVFIRNIETGLLQQGVQVDRIVIAGRGKSLWSKIQKYVRFYLKVITAALDRYDVVHVSYPSHSYLPLMFRRIRRARLVVRLHGLDLVGGVEDTLAHRVGRFFSRIAIRRADLVVVPSRYFEAELTRRHQVKQIYVYPSGGVDMDRFYPAPAPVREPVVSCVGRLDRLKGVDVLIRALARTRLPIRARITGDGRLRFRLEAMVRESSLEDRITFLGRIPQSELVGEYQRAAVFAFPTMRPAESFGNVAMEAMACGLPVIGSRMAGLTDYIREGENGLFFEPGDVQALADAMDNFFAMPDDERDNLRRGALETAARYEKGLVSGKFVQKLYELVGRNSH